MFQPCLILTGTTAATTTTIAKTTQAIKFKILTKERKKRDRINLQQANELNAAAFKSRRRRRESKYYFTTGGNLSFDLFSLLKWVFRPAEVGRGVLRPACVCSSSWCTCRLFKNKKRERVRFAISGRKREEKTRPNFRRSRRRRRRRRHDDQKVFPKFWDWKTELMPAAVVVDQLHRVVSDGKQKKTMQNSSSWQFEVRWASDQI